MPTPMPMPKKNRSSGRFFCTYQKKAVILQAILKMPQKNYDRRSALYAEVDRDPRSRVMM
jgi:hypothetical protein